ICDLFDLNFYNQSVYFFYLLKMRPALAGPGSAKWKPTQDPGKKAASATLSGKSSGGDANSASKGANTQPNKSDGGGH
ncbi:unnamed protein product, partial [Rotaria magnacalcarata]